MASQEHVAWKEQHSIGFETSISLWQSHYILPRCFTEVASQKMQHPKSIMKPLNSVGKHSETFRSVDVVSTARSRSTVVPCWPGPAIFSAAAISKLQWVVYGLKDMFNNDKLLVKRPTGITWYSMASEWLWDSEPQPYFSRNFRSLPPSRFRRYFHLRSCLRVWTASIAVWFTPGTSSFTWEMPEMPVKAPSWKRFWRHKAWGVHGVHIGKAWFGWTFDWILASIADHPQLAMILAHGQAMRIVADRPMVCKAIVRWADHPCSQAVLGPMWSKWDAGQLSDLSEESMVWKLHRGLLKHLQGCITGLSCIIPIDGFEEKVIL